MLVDDTGCILLSVVSLNHHRLVLTPLGQVLLAERPHPPEEHHGLRRYGAAQPRTLERAGPSRDGEVLRARHGGLRQLALAADWAALLSERAHQGWSLLDVACGSGKFPTALVRFTAVASLPGVAYDLLDPSAFSVATARTALAPPFMPRNDLVMPLQELPSSCGPYDVVWATPALYALPPDELDVAMARFHRSWPQKVWGSSLRRRAARTTCRSMTPMGQGA